MTDGRSRKYCFTDFDPSHYDGEYYSTDNPKCTYIIAGRETCPETKRRHLQGFVYFKNPRTLKQVFKLIPGCHISIANGNVEQNIQYCSKELDFYESGERPLSNTQKGVKEKERWTRIKDLAKSGDLDAIEAEEPKLWLIHLDKLEKIALKFSRPPENLPKLNNVWIYGDPGVGKSRWVREFFADKGVFSKNTRSKWWDGYNHHGVALLDDYSPDDAKYTGGSYLKQWADVYPFIAETKGSSFLARPSHIVITSNYSLDYIFGSDRLLYDAIRRRFRQFYISGDPERGEYGSFLEVEDYITQNSQ